MFLKQPVPNVILAEKRGEKNQKYSNNKRSFSRRALVIKEQANKQKKIKHSDHAFIIIIIVIIIVVVVSTTTTIMIIVSDIVTYSV